MNAKTKLAWLVVSLVVFLVSAGPLQGDLVLYMDFEEDAAAQAAGDVVDQSTHGNDGVVETGWDGYDLPQYITSQDGSQAMQFGYSDAGGEGDAWNNVTVPKSDSLTYLGQAWTIAFWIKVDSTNVNGWHEYPKAISCPNYEVDMHSSGDSYSYFWPWDQTWNEWDIAMAATGPYEDSWLHMAVTYDGTTLKQYLNGTVAFSKNNFPGPFDEDTWNDASEFDLKIGTHALGPFNASENGYLVGAMDDVAIFNETLDATQVATIMGGDFSGPWQPSQLTVESDLPINYVYDPSFIATRGTFPLSLGEKEPNMPVWWNWDMEGTLDNGDWHGIVNAGLWDGDPMSIEYAGFCTVGDQITQTVIRRQINKDTVYTFTATVGGENAVGNVVGVKYYAVDETEALTLLADLNQTIAANETWYDLQYTYTPDTAQDGDSFKLVCYIEQGSGNGRGTAFATIDKARIDPASFGNCAAWTDYNDGSTGLANDFNQDCVVNLPDYNVVAGGWGDSIASEPMDTTNELLSNPDFYADIDRVPDYWDSDLGAPTGWDIDSLGGTAGIWNLSQSGHVHSFDVQPAGGSVAVFLEPNDVLQQTVLTPLVNGQTYYLSAMLGGTGEAYLNVVSATWERVDNPVTPTVVTEIAKSQFVPPLDIVWRQFTTEYTADAAAAGDYLRVRCEYELTEFSSDVGFGLVGHVSATTVAPAVWPRENLLSNGDFEDVSLVNPGDLGELLTEGGYTIFVGAGDYPPGWTFATMTAQESAGLQCMLWAPAPQPTQGRVSVWYGNFGSVTGGPRLEQKVTAETIQNGQTYYLDFVGSISASAFNDGSWTWPDPNPQIIAEVYWLAAGQNDLSGTQGTDYGLIATAAAEVDGSLGAMNGHWSMGETSFTADASMAGKSFYVSVYGEAPYTTLEEVVLSKEAPAEVGPFNCYESTAIYGLGLEADLNVDCVVGVDDLSVFANTWLDQAQY